MLLATKSIHPLPAHYIAIRTNFIHHMGLYYLQHEAYHPHFIDAYSHCRIHMLASLGNQNGEAGVHARLWYEFTPYYKKGNAK